MSSKREFKVLRGFIIGCQNPSNIRHPDDTVIITEVKMNLQELLQKLLKDINKNGMNIDCKKNLSAK